MPLPLGPRRELAPTLGVGGKLGGDNTMDNSTTLDSTVNRQAPQRASPNSLPLSLVTPSGSGLGPAARVAPTCYGALKEFSKRKMSLLRCGRCGVEILSGENRLRISNGVNFLFVNFTNV